MIYFRTVLLLLIFVFTLSISAFSQNTGLTVEKKTELILKEGPDYPDYFVSRVRAIQVDSDDNIYIAEGQQNIIYKFDPQGGLIQTIGREGRGPGEFEDIRLFKIRKDTLYVFTRGTASLIRYDTEGSLLGSVVSPSWTTLDMEPTNFGYLLNLNPASYSDLSKPFLGRVNRDLEFLSPSGIRFADLYQEEQDEITGKLAGNSPVEMLRLDDDRLLIAPDMYDGQIFEVTFDPDTESWSLTDTLESFPRGDFYTEVGRTDPKGIDHIFVDQNRGGMTILQVHHESYGLYKRSDGMILHFVKRDTESAREYGVEIFDQERNYLGYHVLQQDEDRLDDENNTQSRIFAMDSQDRFYLYRPAPEGGTMVEVFSLQIAKES